MKAQIESLCFLDKVDLAIKNDEFKYTFNIGMAFEGYLEEMGQELQDKYLDYLNNKNKSEEISFPAYCFRFFILDVLNNVLEIEYGT